jgi:hypothetical protein
VRYRFVHVLYQNALFAALAPSRRVRQGLRAGGARNVSPVAMRICRCSRRSTRCSEVPEPRPSRR